MTTTVEARTAAHRRVGALKGLYIHAAVFAVVNLFLLVIDLVTGGPLWFYWASLGWGVGLVIHAAVTFLVAGAGHDRLRSWEDRQVERFAARS